MKRRRHLTATELSECCICEQRVVFDRQRGRRRTAESRKQMRLGQAVHAARHRDAMQDLAGHRRFARPSATGDLVGGARRLRVAIGAPLRAVARWLASWRAWRAP
jgi:hypothetical protein